MSLFLRQIDLLGKETSLMVNNKRKFNTVIGGLLTIILVLTSILAFIAFGRDIIEKNEPQITFWKNPSSEVQFDFSPNFTYVISVYDPVKNIHIPEIEKLLRFYIVTQDVNPDLRFENKSVIEEFFEMEKCSNDKLTPEVNNTLFLSFDSYFCMPKNITLPLKGTLVTGKNRVFKLNVDYCNNSTFNNNTCYSKDIISEKLPSVFNFHYIIFDNYPEHTDYKNPIKPTIISSLTRSNINTMTRLVYWLKNVEYFTDESWILKSLKKEVFTSIDRIEAQIFPTPNTKTFFSHMFTISSMKENYHRSYIKVQGVAAYIGGFITLFKMTLSVICEYLTKPFFLNFFFEHFHSAVASPNNETEMIMKSNVNNNLFQNAKLYKQSISIKNNFKNDVSSNQVNVNMSIKNYKPDKISILNVLLRCLKISNDFDNYINFIDKLFNENISIEKLCQIICRQYLVEERILKNKDFFVEDCNPPSTNKMAISKMG